MKVLFNITIILFISFFLFASGLLDEFMSDGDFVEILTIANFIILVYILYLLKKT
ncbi:hypothetical protein [Thalassobacillus pellis]|uniref:hypothetical protein n=1 Tax=Thalassobacillus pellis TaxID=748008 RepID=UPI00196219E8|nr:hypothetical protein [Thalassobacillus pellis]MBM7553527.1 hypothetical protein [Thalassobacillus pellis]